jgi:hypothetical protein
MGPVHDYCRDFLVATTTWVIGRAHTRCCAFAIVIFLAAICGLMQDGLSQSSREHGRW